MEPRRTNTRCSASKRSNPPSLGLSACKIGRHVRAHGFGQAVIRSSERRRPEASGACRPIGRRLTSSLHPRGTRNFGRVATRSKKESAQGGRYVNARRTCLASVGGVLLVLGAVEVGGA